MNKEDYVSLKVAKLLKRKGYNESTLMYYTDDGILHESNNRSWHEYNIEFVKETCPYSWDCKKRRCDNSCEHYKVYVTAAPTIYEVQRWLRKEHKLFVNSFISNPFIEPCTFIWSLQNLKEGPEDYTVTVSVCSYYSFEKALEEGISEALKLS